MRGKRSKQYRKLMHQYQLSFNFREPYQVLVDAQMIQDAARYKMPLAQSLERTLHGQVKPMITQCSIRHLYTAESTDSFAKDAWIATAKSFERRRCNHHTLDEPLSTLECLNSVVDPKDSATNKHRYVVASQGGDVRAKMRRVAGVPLIYINRSVMIMEPMAAKSEDIREKEERAKTRAGLKSRRGANEDGGAKRKRDEESDGEDERDADRSAQSGVDGARTQPEPMRKKQRKGPKGPNPLSMKKSKKVVNAAVEQDKQALRKVMKRDPQADRKVLSMDVAEPHETKEVLGADMAVTGQVDDAPAKRKRKRKHKTSDGPAVVAAEPAAEEA